jgi:hypothetical protein
MCYRAEGQSLSAEHAQAFASVPVHAKQHVECCVPMPCEVRFDGHACLADGTSCHCSPLRSCPACGRWAIPRHGFHTFENDLHTPRYRPRHLSMDPCHVTLSDSLEMASHQGVWRPASSCSCKSADMSVKLLQATPVGSVVKSFHSCRFRRSQGPAA